MVITGETIKSAIALKLSSQFNTLDGQPFNIYKETPLQHMKKPCFFISEIDVEQEKQMKHSFERVYQMNIRFHASDNIDNEREVFSDTGNKVLEILEAIDVPMLVSYDLNGNPVVLDKPVRGTQASFKVVDGVLLVFITFVIRIKRVIDIPDMGKLKQTQYIKERR